MSQGHGWERGGREASGEERGRGDGERGGGERDGEWERKWEGEQGIKVKDVSGGGRGKEGEQNKGVKQKERGKSATEIGKRAI